MVLGVLVLAHEFGHFFVAKKSGMAVEEFGFGFPPRLLGIQFFKDKPIKKAGFSEAVATRTEDVIPAQGGTKTQESTGVATEAYGTSEKKWHFILGSKEPLDKERTVYSINWIPFGGFVKIRGENNEHAEDPKSFINRPFWGRFFTLVAGVAMNFLLAWVLLSVCLTLGLPAGIDNPKQISRYAEMKNLQIGVDGLVKDYPAEKAGVKAGDVIVSIDNKNFANADELRMYVRANPGKKFQVQIQRLNQNLQIEIESLKNPPADQGPTGMSLTSFGKLTVPWYVAPWVGLKAAAIQTANIFSGLYSLITGKIGLNNVGGPVKIAQLTGEVGRMGAVYLMQFTATLSLNLAILNILPFPALDGGRVFLLLVEKARGKRNNQKLEQWINTVGFVFLILLMILVTIKDVKGF